MPAFSKLRRVAGPAAVRPTLKRDTSAVLDAAHVHRLASNSPGKRKGRRRLACRARFLYLPPRAFAVRRWSRAE